MVTATSQEREGRRVRVFAPGDLGLGAGAVLAAAFLPCLVAELFAGGLFGNPWVTGVGFASSVGWLYASLAGEQRPTMARRMFSLGMAGTLGLAGQALARSPMLALCVLVTATAVVAGIYRDQIFPTLRHRGLLRLHPLPRLSARGAGLMTGLLWLMTDLTAHGPSPVVMAVMAWALFITAAFSLAWLRRFHTTYRKRAPAVAFALLLQAGAAVFSVRFPLQALSVVALLAWVIAVAVKVPSRVDDADGWEMLLGHPERLLAGTFALLSILGTLLLSLPQSAAGGHEIMPLDAMFTAVSAVCVTGLAVLDTPGDFSLFGQLMILLLIQVGGLGIMTFSTAAAWAFGRRLSMRHEQAAASLLGTTDRRQLFTSAQRILQFTFSVELVGFVALTIAFLIHGDSLPQAVYRGLFTSISAFCNAGFALQSDSLVGYQSSPFVLHVVGLLIILGGLSPAATLAIPRLLRGKRIQAPASIALILGANAALLVFGFVLVLALEWHNTLQGLSFADRLHNAWFQSVTMRTAGFNSVDLAAVGPATLTVFMLLMFIGGSPGGTAGGVKVTTVAVLWLSVLKTVLGASHASVAHRRVPQQTMQKAALVVTVSALGFFLALVALQVTQRMTYQESMFEVMSALGTVGVTIGGTAKLDEIGKVIVAACMFVGRVGGLTLLLLLVSRYERRVQLSWPEEDVAVG